MENYCNALLNQERSLEDLQKHLRTTESLFRESVKRKNQQLDLLQSEVRRLKTSVGVRDEAASLQIDAALNAQAGELRRAKESLAARDGEVDKLNRQVNELTLSLADEKAKLVAEQAQGAEAHNLKLALQQREDELDAVRAELADAQKAAVRMQNAQAEAEAGLEQRDAEIAALAAENERLAAAGGGAGAGAGAATSAEVEGLREEMAIMLKKMQDKVNEESRARQDAEAHLASMERGREELEAALEEERQARQEMEEEMEAMAKQGGGYAREDVERQPPPQQPPPQAPHAQAAKKEAAAPPSSSSSSAATAATSSSSSSSSGAAMMMAGGVPNVRSLMVTGDPIVSSTLTADAVFAGGASEGASVYEWFWADRKSVALATGRRYTPTADDLTHEIEVRVTPGTSAGGKGTPKNAVANAPIAIPEEVKEKLTEWYQLSQKGFPGCHSGDKELQVLFTQKNLKLRDKKGKSDAKSDGYSSVSLELSPSDDTVFELALGGKKGTTTTLTAPNRQVRDLIALTYRVFADPKNVAAIPGVATSSPSLLANAVGVLHTSHKAGDSPASSVTGENPSLADVDDASSKASGSAKGSSGKKLASAGRMLSFGRAPKSKK